MLRKENAAAVQVESNAGNPVPVINDGISGGVYVGRVKTALGVKIISD